MSESTELIDDADRVALLREGIVVLRTLTRSDRLYVDIAGAPDDRMKLVNQPPVTMP